MWRNQMAKRTQSFDAVTITATSAAGMNIADTVRFHAFNPRGLVKTQRRIDDAVRALVDAGVVRSGAHLAYGSLDKKVSAISLSSMISAYEHRNAAATAFVVENGGVVAAPVNISG
jgi:hypothetical protein